MGVLSCPSVYCSALFANINGLGTHILIDCPDVCQRNYTILIVESGVGEVDPSISPPTVAKAIERIVTRNLTVGAEVNISIPPTIAKAKESK